MTDLEKEVFENTISGKIHRKTGIELLKKLKELEERQCEDIAVIGMAVRLPGADNLEEFWELLVNGKDCVTDFPEGRKNDIDNYLKKNKQFPKDYEKGAYLEEVDKFDYKFFNMPPVEADVMNPNQRIFLETAWKAIEHAGYGGGLLSKTKTGVYVGYIGDTDGVKYKQMLLDSDSSLGAVSTTGNLPSIMPARLSYLLDLTGPSMLIDSACSSSLLSVHIACQELSCGNCNVALAGGIRINLMPFDEKEKLGIESPDGRTRTFDDKANGTGIGEGVGIVVLKPLDKAQKDNDTIYAVIKGSNSNQDGTSAGITAPNALAQAELISTAWENAKIEPTTISYIETHGTGTNVGDPIEIDGITHAFEKYTKRKQFCGIGSLKPNIGHLYEASGVTGMIKAILALNHKMLPPSIHFETPNRKIDFENSPVYVVDKLIKWEKEDAPRRCGVSAFGFSGTNVHVILEEAPCYEREERELGCIHVLTLSARSQSSLKMLVSSYKKYLAEELQYSIEDICYTANVARGQYEYRLVFAFHEIEELRNQLAHIDFKQNQMEEGIYYGKHNLIRSERERKEDSDYTYVQKQALSQKAKELINGLTISGAGAGLEELCRLYIDGADVPWSLLYGEGKYKRVPVPTYEFDKYRCWIRIEDIVEDENYFYNIKWIKQDICKKTPFIEKRTVLFIAKEKSNIDSLVNQFTSENIQVIKVHFGEQYLHLSENEFQIHNTKQDFAKLLEEIKDSSFTDILYLPALKDNKLEEHELQIRIQEGVVSLYYLVHAIAKVGLLHPCRLLLVANNAYMVSKEDYIYAESAVLFGYGRALSRELPNVMCKCVDIDNISDDSWLLKELACEDENYLCAYRSGERYVEQFQIYDTSSQQEQGVGIKEQGVYVITGGTGDIGLEVARYLADRAKVTIVLISRSEFPEASIWNSILAGDKMDLQKKIKAIQAIQNRGNQILVLKADVTKFQELNEAMNTVRKIYGKIDGVFHCAGVMGHEMIVNQEEEALWNVLGPKILGTDNLNRATEQDELDFFVMFSSLSAVMCPVGQTSYAAANAYMDAFADYRNQLGKNTYSINWCMWNQTGMAVRNHMNLDTVFKTIDTDCALACLDQIIRNGMHRVIVGKINYENAIVKLLTKSGIQLSDEILGKIEASLDSKEEQGRQKTGKNNRKKKITNDEVEAEVVRICQDALGYEELDMEQSFFDLGADSIILTMMLRKLNESFPVDLTLAKLFNYSTIIKLSNYISDALEETKSEKNYVNDDGEMCQEGIAIIGMSVRFPNSESLDEYWDIIEHGRDCIEEFPEERRELVRELLRLRGMDVDKTTFSKAGFLHGIDEFDYKFFKLSPNEASLMDPNQRIFLQTAYKALEDAGYASNEISGTRTGVYVGYCRNYKENYGAWIAECDAESVSMSIPANLASVIPSRLSYLLDLKGPSMIIDTACSSSLVAVHTACKAMQNGECDMAVAGGIKMHLLPIEGKAVLGIEASDYRTRAFSEDSDGTGIGEGIAAVILKPLSRAIEDHDQIYAVIKGSAVNQDGSSVGITAPNAASQTDVIINAWKNANVNPETISYIEAHGTGTKLGDPIEIEGLQDAFRAYTDKKQFCGISAVKTNIGHLYEASGIAGLIKACLSLKYKKIAPSIHFKKANPKIDFQNTAMYMNTKLQDWIPDCGIRRCGVSSFGLSGTNCHMILEEYQEERARSQEDSSMQIVTISARSEYSLKSYIKQLEKKISHGLGNLTDIAYSLNTGKNQYEYRVVFLAQTIEQLHEQLKELTTGGIRTVEEQEIYYGIHHVSAKEYQVHEDGYITSKQKKELNLLVEKEVEDYRKANEKQVGKIRQIAKFFVQGADIDWHRFYQNKDYQRISLPTYEFEKTKCWFHVNSTPMVNTLIDQIVVELMDEVVYKTAFSVKRHFVLRDHVILGRYVIPGTTYVEMASEISRNFFDGPIELYDMLFFQPVTIEQEEVREVYSKVKIEEDNIVITFMSKIEDDNATTTWMKHASVAVRKVYDNAKAQHSLEDIRKLCNKECLDIEQNELTKGFIDFGPHWLVYHKLYKGEGCALAELKNPQEFDADLEKYTLHPSLLDMATSALVLTSGKKYLPLSYHSIKVYQSLPAKFYSYIRTKAREAQKNEIVSYDITLVTEDGVVLADIEDFCLKSADKFGKEMFRNHYYETKWFQSTLVSEKENVQNGYVMIIGNSLAEQKPLTAELESSGLKVITVEYQDTYQELGDCHFTVGDCYEDYCKLMNRIRSYSVNYMVHLANVHQNPQTLLALEDDVEQGVQSLFYLVKAIAESKNNQNIKILVLGKNVNRVIGEEDGVNASGQALFGIANVVSNEFVNINCVCLDVDKITVSDITSELFNKQKEKVVAYRAGTRYQAEIVQMSLPAKQDRNVVMKTEGCYLITGGTGGLGLVIAEYLAKQANVNIVLLSRSGLPDRENWSKLIETEHKIAKTIEKIEQIELLGSQVAVYQVDVADYDNLSVVIKEIRTIYGRINAIVHCAGVAGSEFIINKDIQDFKQVISPKIYGTWNLSELTKEDDLDFFVLFSSVATLLAMPGQADYTAANAYMNGFAEENHLTSIGWSSWKEVGMAYDNNADIDTVYQAIGVEEAIKAFDEILHKDIRNVYVGELNPKADMFFDYMPVPFSKTVMRKVRKFALKKTENSSEDRIGVVLKGRSEEIYSQTELEVAQIWAEVLGVQEIDIHETFYDLGGDSILAMRVISKVNARFKVKVEVTMVFEYITIGEFASFLEHLTVEEKPKMENEDKHQLSIAEQKEYYPIAVQQQRIFMWELMVEGTKSTAYNVPIMLTIEGKLDKERFEKVLKQLTRENECLRTSFTIIDGVPVQKINDVEFQMGYMELSEEEIEKAVREFIVPFDLSKAPLFRVTLIKSGEERYLMMFDIHHIIADGTSIGFLFQRLMSMYYGSKEEKLSHKYVDYVEWQNEFYQSKEGKMELDYWMDVLSGTLPALDMPLDYERPSMPEFLGDTIEFYLDEEWTTKFKTVLKEQNLTLFMGLLAAYNILLSKYTGQHDIIVGSPITGRVHGEMEQVIGMFVNMLPLRSHLKKEQTVAEFMNQIRENTIKAYEHQSFSMSDLLHGLDIERIVNRNPLFDTMLVFQNSNSEVEISDIGVPKVDMKTKDFHLKTFYDFEHKISKFDFSIEAFEREGSIAFYLEYSTELFKKDRMENFAKSFINVIKKVTEEPDTEIERLDIIDQYLKEDIVSSIHKVQDDFVIEYDF